MALGITLTSPWWLAAALVLPYAWWTWHRYVRQLGITASHRFVPGLRVVTLCLLILTLSGATLRTPLRGVDLYVLLDGSASVSLNEQRKAREVVRTLGTLLGPADQMSVFAFGRDIVSLGVYSQDIQPATNFQASPDPSATRLAYALEGILQRLPPQSNARILVISDGVETHDTALRLADIAARRDVPIDAFPLSFRYDHEVLVESLTLPQLVTRGEPHDLRAVIVSSTATPAELLLYRDGSLIAQRSVALETGRNLIVFDGLQMMDEWDGAVTYELRVNPVEDGFLQNNVGYGLVRAEDEARVLIIAREPDAGADFKGLLEEQGISVDVRPSNGLAIDAASLVKYRAVILVDVAATSLSQAQLEVLAHFVEDTGGGLLAIGGVHSFGLGGYARTELERLLPVSMDAPQNVIMPSLAMVLTLDRSGSMAETQGAFSKLDLAKEAALGVLDLMNENDLIGVLAFDSLPYWVVPPQPVENRIAIASSIASLSAEGGTNLAPALASALESLREVEASLKHLIVLSDGRSTPGDFQELTRRLRDAGVTVSTVGIGRDADRELLAQIAQWGDGRHYYTDDIRAIPQIFATETTVMTRPMRIDAPFTPAWHQQADFWHDTTSPPALGGYVITTPKASAAVHLKAPDESPILSTWRRGLGKAAAFTSSIHGAWLGDWRDWDGYGPLFGQLVRWLMRPDPAEGLLAQMTIDAGLGRLIVDALEPDGGFRNFLDLEAQVIAPDGSLLVIELEQIAPGRYQGEFTAGTQGVYTAFITGSDGAEPVSTTAGAVLSYPDEYRVLRPDSSLLHGLAERTGGVILTEATADALKRLLRHPAPTYALRPLAPMLLAAALIVFFLDVLIRYVPFHVVSRRPTTGGDEDGAPRRSTDEAAIRARLAADDAASRQPKAGRTSTSAAGHHVAQQAGKYLAQRRKQNRKEQESGETA